MSSEKEHISSKRETGDGRKSTWISKMSLPDWLTEAVRMPRTWKTFARCLVALLVTMVLLVTRESLNFLGQAAFFGLITAIMLPPYMALSLFLFAGIALGVGMCIGWAWGCAAMAAGLRARSQTLLAQNTQAFRAGINPNGNVATQQRQAVFEGQWLDARCTAVFGVFLFIGTYFFGWIRATRPKLVLLSVFGSIILDLMCSYGPLFPSQQYTLARQLLLPAALYIATGAACTILIFPQSLNHIVLTDLIRSNLQPIQSMVRLQDTVVTTSPSDKAKVSELSGKLVGLRAKHVAGVNALEGQLGFLGLEITRGQIGGKDLVEIFKKFKQLGGRAYALSSFMILLNERHESAQSHKDQPSATPYTAMSHHMDMTRKHQHPGTDLDELLPSVASSTEDLRRASDTALEDAMTWLDAVNHSRWRRPPASLPSLEHRENNLANLKRALEEYRSDKHFAVLEPYRGIFDDKGKLKPGHARRIRYSTPSLFRCHVFTSNLIAYNKNLVQVLELLLQVERANPKAKIQMPTAFAKKIVESANQSDGTNPLDRGTDMTDFDHSDDASTSSGASTIEAEKRKAQQSTKGDAGKTSKGSAIHRLSRSLAAAWKGFWSDAGIFALKYGIVSIALWIPQICRSSAYFTYENKGLWALIMAQTALGVYTGEQVITFVVRMTGTVIGLVIGMVIWYIGAPGNGSGNPYGLAAATVVFMGPVILLRVIAPPRTLQFWIIMGATIGLVVGYSWVDEKIPQVGNVGSGAALAGRRALLVIIGFTAAFIIMIFPRPVSARQVLRRNLAKTIKSTSSLYSQIVEDIADQTSHPDHSVDAQERLDRYRSHFLKLLGKLQEVEQQMSYARFEPGLKGSWPKRKYDNCIKAERQIVASLALLVSAYADLQPQWCDKLSKMHAMNPAFIQDCLSLFETLQDSMRQAKPVNQTTPIMEKLALRALAKPIQDHDSNNSHHDDDRQDDDEREASMEAKEDQAALRSLGQPMTWDLCHDEQLAIFATATVALTQITNGLNDLQRAVISILGETEPSVYDKTQGQRAGEAV